jgi:hypothetical protein
VLSDKLKTGRQAGRQAGRQTDRQTQGTTRLGNGARRDTHEDVLGGCVRWSVPTIAAREPFRPRRGRPRLNSKSAGTVSSSARMCDGSPPWENYGPNVLSCLPNRHEMSSSARMCDGSPPWEPKGTLRLCGPRHYQTDRQTRLALTTPGGARNQAGRQTCGHVDRQGRAGQNTNACIP